MLFVNLKGFDASDYSRILEAVNFLNTTDLTTTPLGRSHQSGESFYCQTLEYRTEDINNFQFEIHEKRLDLHYIVSGEEQIDVSPDTAFVPVTEYNSDRDIQYVKEPSHYNNVILHAGDFVLIGMHEPHRTNGMVDGKPSDVRKIVLKLGKEK